MNTAPNDIDRLYKRLTGMEQASLVNHLNAGRQKVIWVGEEFIGVFVMSPHLEIKTQRNHWASGVKKNG